MPRLAALLFLALAAPARADVDAGNWELTVTGSIEGMPGSIAPVTQTHCLTAEDARNPAKLVGGSGCQFSNQKDSGSEITFDVACGGQLPMRGSGVVRYSPQNLDASLDLSAGEGSQRMAMHSHVAGRRLGAC